MSLKGLSSLLTPKLPGKIALGFSLAILATVLQLLLWQWVGPSRFIVYYPGVIIASLLGGLVSGATATIVGAITAVLLFFPELEHGLTSVAQLAPVLLFLTSGIVIAYLSEAVSRYRQSRGQDKIIQTTLDRASDGFVSVDRHWRFVYLNSASENILKMPRESLLGKTLWTCFPETLGTAFEINFRRAMDDQQPVSFKAAYPSLNAYFDVTVYPSSDGLSIYYRDISGQLNLEQERSQISRALEHQVALLQALVNQLPTGIVVAEAPSGRILHINPQIDKIWRGKSPASESIEEYSEWIGFHPNGARYAAEEWPLARTIRTGETITDEEVKILRRDGTYGTVLISSAPITDHDGKVVAAVVVDTDITERKAMEEELRENRNRLQEALSIRDEFISIASHELKTPLTAMSFQTQLLLRRHAKGAGLSVDETIRRVNTFQTQLDRITRLVDDMLEISRINTRKLQLDRRQLDLAQIVSNVSQRFQDQVEHAQCNLKMDLNEVNGKWDEGRLEQVYVNLLMNGLKYAPGSQISVRTFKDGEKGVLEVQDSGPGIPNELQERIFERFERAGADENVSGLGLGLYITKSIVELHGGSIEVESEPKRGSLFRVTLPLEPAA